jgi:hypothetical protein
VSGDWSEDGRRFETYRSPRRPDQCRWKITKFAGSSTRNLLTPEIDYRSIARAKMGIHTFKAAHPDLAHLPVWDRTD